MATTRGGLYPTNGDWESDSEPPHPNEKISCVEGDIYIFIVNTKKGRIKYQINDGKKKIY